MKKRLIQPVNVADANVAALAQAISSMRTTEEVIDLLSDLCTPTELEALSDRWQVVPYLLRGVPYREIHSHTGVSVTTIGRVARFLLMGEGGYRLAAKRLGIQPVVTSALSNSQAGTVKFVAKSVIPSATGSKLSRPGRQR